MSRGPCLDAAPERDAEPAEDSLSAIIYESDTETKLKKKTSYKLLKSPKSPYSSSTCLHPRKAGLLRSFKTAENKHFDGSSVKASRQLRRGPHKQGAWVGQTKSELVNNRARSALPSNTPEYLKDALGMKKPKHGRSSASGYIPGTPDYKEKEDMYDEIIELKKKIQVQKNETDRMKTKLRRLEEDNNRKDKQIDQLLESSKSSEFPWTRTEQKNDNSSVINGLKQKILRLEQQCKEKDNCINKLQTDLKSTNAEEMRITLQSYYEEIQRLQTLLAKSKAVQQKSSAESQEHKVLSAAILQLSRSIKELEEENQSLKVDLGRALASSPASSKANYYAEKTRKRLVRRISKLGKRMDENAGLQLSEAITSPLVSPSAMAQLSHPAAWASSHPEEHEHLRRVVKKLKGHMAVLQNLLAVKEEEIWKLTHSMRELEEQHKANCRQASSVEATELSDQGQQELHIGAQQFHPTCTFTSRSSDSGPSLLHPLEHQTEEQAAQIIQRRWKAYKTKIKEDAQNKNPDSSPGPSSLQMATDCKAEEEVVKLIQSVFRAHITRTQLAERPLISSPGDEKTSPVASSGEKKPVWSIFRHAPLVFTSTVPATSSQDRQLPSPSAPANETYSDDSDDIITTSSSSVKEKSPFDFNSYLSHSLLRS